MQKSNFISVSCDEMIGFANQSWLSIHVYGTKNEKGLGHFTKFAKGGRWDHFNNLTKIIVKSLMECGSLNEKKIANKLVCFGANDVTIFQGAKIGVIT